MNEHVNAYKQERLIRWQTAADVKTTWILLIVSWVLFLIPFCGSGVVGWILNGIAFVRCTKIINEGNKVGGMVPLLASVILSPIMFIIGLLLFSFLEPKKPVAPPQQEQQQIQPARPRPQSTRETSV